MRVVEALENVALGLHTRVSNPPTILQPDKCPIRIGWLLLGLQRDVPPGPAADDPVRDERRVTDEERPLPLDLRVVDFQFVSPAAKI